MRLFTTFFLLISTFCVSQNLKELRTEYPKANLDETITNTLYKKLSSTTKDENKTVVAYKGAITTLKAKYAQGVKNKKSFFKEGAELLEYAVASKPEDIEIRCLRLGVQENSPKIVGYKKNIEADRQFLLDHYKSTENKDVKNFVKGYVLFSNLFSEAEKQLF